MMSLRNQLLKQKEVKEEPAVEQEETVKETAEEPAKEVEE